jgi:heavy metal sensor kinase
MFDSVRAQLTFWYTGVLALVLVVFAITSYLFLANLMMSRADASLLESADAFAATLVAEQSDGATPDDAAREAVREFRFRDRRFIVLDADAQIIAHSSDPPPRNHSDKRDKDERGKHDSLTSPNIRRSLIEAAARGDKTFLMLTGGEEDEEMRAFASQVRIGDRAYTVVVMLSLHEQEETLEAVRRVFYVAVPLALLLASAGGYFLARKSLAPIVAMSEAAQRIGAADLSQRLPVANERDELGKLAAVFNNLLARLHASFEQQRRFMADASHELRTPVAIVRGEAEVALSQSARPREDLRESLSIVHDEGRRLTRIVEDLFTLARADAGQHALIKLNLYLDEVACEAVRAVRTLAAQREVFINCDAPSEMPFHGDELLLRRMLTNLLDNALKHTPAEGSVEVKCAQQDDEYLLTVSDTGCGIPDEAQAHIFERFYRADNARARPTTDSPTDAANDADSPYSASGAGLGLSIARWVAEAHGGKIMLRRSDNTGSTFIVSLPIAN